MLLCNSTRPLALLNGDNPLKNKFYKKLFFKINKYYNNKNHKIDKRISIHNFKLKFIDKIKTTSSPSRFLIDSFLNSIDWELLIEFMDTSLINFHDAGCGNGRYSQLLLKLLNKKMIYKGFDVKTNAKLDNYFADNISFKIIKSNSYSEMFDGGKYNFFISITSAEHMKYDLKYFKGIYEFINMVNKPIIQVHFLLSPVCLELYGLHGYRQYNEYSISKITRLYDDKNFIYLYYLGGKACNNIHRKYILSDNGDIRNKHVEQYAEDLRKAVIEDCGKENNSEPGFYALVIKSNFKNDFSLFKHLI